MSTELGATSRDEQSHTRHEGTPGAVTPVELFFDIVFVFTLTQLTRTLEADLSWATAGRILAVFVILWWMYGGYAWLTNHVPPRRTPIKLTLFAGMAGFLVAAVGIPAAFEGGGVIFGVGYLIVVCIHLLLFGQWSDARAGVARLAPYNVGSALLILFAGFLHGPSVYAVWVGAFVLMSVVPYWTPKYSWVGFAHSFHLSPPHFVERHGLLVLIALGESVIAIGAGSDITNFGVGSVAVTVMALLLPATLWWTYFTDVHPAEHALVAASPRDRSLLSVRAYFFCHIPMLLGIVVASAGIHAAVAHPARASDLPSAIALAGGVALFLFGMAEFRRCLRIGSPSSRVLTALAVLAAIPLARVTSAGVQLGAVIAMVVGMLLIEARTRQH